MRIDEGTDFKPFPVANSFTKEDHGFGRRLSEALKSVNHLQNAADDSTQQVVEGELGIHEGMLALSEADVSLRLMLQVRNKIMDAYKEIMRMGL